MDSAPSSIASRNILLLSPVVNVRIRKVDFRLQVAKMLCLSASNSRKSTKRSSRSNRQRSSSRSKRSSSRSRKRSFSKKAAKKAKKRKEEMEVIYRARTVKLVFMLFVQSWSLYRL